MPAHPVIRGALACGALASSLMPMVAMAQTDPRIGSYGAPSQAPQGGYSQDPYTRDGYPQRDDGRDYRQGGYDQGGYQSQPQGYYANGAPMPEPAPPPGYDGTRPPPPPAGYVASTEDRQDYDDRYAADAERWAQENCVKSANNAGVGALFGGVLGAIIGSSVAGRHDRGAGAFAGAAIGAVGGAAVGSQSRNDTSPGCPPGYSVRRGATTYVYSEPSYTYAAPGWYRPWVYVGDAWVYRPYPYHGWYYRNYRVREWGGPGWYGRPGWRGHGYYRRGW